MVPDQGPQAIAWIGSGHKTGTGVFQFLGTGQIFEIDCALIGATVYSPDSLAAVEAHVEPMKKFSWKQQQRRLPNFLR